MSAREKGLSVRTGRPLNAPQKRVERIVPVGFHYNGPCGAYLATTEKR